MNCKPGDLAVIIRARNTPQILGHIVRVIRPWTSGRNVDDRFAWECEYPDGRLILQSWEPVVLYTYERTRPIADEVLRPIRPDETPEESTEAMRRLHDTTVKQGEPA